MLASIHPLGERARGQQYAVTVAAYGFGSILGAAGFGSILGAAGEWMFGNGFGLVRMIGFGAAALIAVAFEGRDRRPPSWHRQVNEDWLTQFRGWVYGLGFGLQLGLGVVTIVTTASVYLVWLGALVSGSIIGGAVVGAAFGAARSVPVMAGFTIRNPRALRDRVQNLHDRSGSFRNVTRLVEVAAALVVMTAAALAVGVSN